MRWPPPLLLLLSLALPSLAAAASWPARATVTARGGPVPFRDRWRQCAELRIANGMAADVGARWAATLALDGGELLDFAGADFEAAPGSTASRRLYALRPRDAALSVVPAGGELPGLPFCVAYRTTWAADFDVRLSPEDEHDLPAGEQGSQYVVQVSPEGESGPRHHLLLRRQSDTTTFTKNFDTGYCSCIPTSGWVPTDPLTPLLGCPSLLPMNALPAFLPALTNMTRDVITAGAQSPVVPGREVSMRLGPAEGPEKCKADRAPDVPNCRWLFTLSGNWESLRDCGWSAPDTTTIPGYEVRNNTIRLEWKDRLPDGRLSTNSILLPVSIRFPAFVQLDTSIAMVDESGVKNFSLDALLLQGLPGSRYLTVRWKMHSRWPHNLTLASNALDLPYIPAGPVTAPAWNPPVCIKNSSHPDQTPGSGTFTASWTHASSGFTVNDFCYQSGSFLIPLGGRCDVGGRYTVAFDTSCFVVMTADNVCAGQRLQAAFEIGTAPGQLSLDVCNGQGA